MAAPDKQDKLILDEFEGIRSLQFSSKAVQSSMRLSEPFELELSYTKAMIGFLLFNDEPKHILIVGLGGGSLSKYCYHQFPQARITTLEINPEVIDLRDDFLVPRDDERFQVVQMDAADYLKRNDIQADIILLDGFVEEGLPECLSSKLFYANCHRVLGLNGVLVANLFGSRRKVGVYLNRLRGVFNHPVWISKAFESPNLIAFALKEKKHFPHWPGLLTKAKRLEERYRLNLPWVVKNMHLRQARDLAR